MGKEKRIALIFSYDESWIGGTYYVLNLIHALNSLPDGEKPQICILCKYKSDFEIVLKETNYPNLDYTLIEDVRYSILDRVRNKYSRIVYGKNLIDKFLPDNFDFVFPNPEGYFFSKIDIEKKGYWIPDFQEDYFPDFFPDEELMCRKQYHIYVAVKVKKLILSSVSALNDFNRFYSFSRCKTVVLPFAVSHPDLTKYDITEIRSKYSITSNYFFCPNQFFAHKNHRIVLEAINELKDQGISVNVLFSGKENDYRQPEYFGLIRSIVASCQLQDQVRFLGFIPREDQLMLMKHSLAIIQPSLFEGWSTVVEDAKALNQLIVVSDIPVHREQIIQNAVFFNPKDKFDLVQKMEMVLKQQSIISIFDYTENIKRFAGSFMKIVGEC